MALMVLAVTATRLAAAAMISRQHRAGKRGQSMADRGVRHAETTASWPARLRHGRQARIPSANAGMAASAMRQRAKG
jgi:hypothetical protein